MAHRGSSAVELMSDALQFVVEALDFIIVQTDLSFKCSLHLLELVAALVQSVKQHCDLRCRVSIDQQMHKTKDIV